MCSPSISRRISSKSINSSRSHRRRPHTFQFLRDCLNCAGGRRTSRARARAAFSSAPARRRRPLAQTPHRARALGLLGGAPWPRRARRDGGASPRSGASTPPWPRAAAAACTPRAPSARGRGSRTPPPAPSAAAPSRRASPREPARPRARARALSAARRRRARALSHLVHHAELGVHHDLLLQLARAGERDELFEVELAVAVGVGALHDVADDLLLRLLPEQLGERLAELGDVDRSRAVRVKLLEDVLQVLRVARREPAVEARRHALGLALRGAPAAASPP